VIEMARRKIKLTEELVKNAAAYSFKCDAFPKGTTIRWYLIELLAKVWEQGEGFNGKRPFGNSGWENDLYLPLVAGGFVKGELDEDGCLDLVDNESANTLVFAIIESMR
jgi:hypothetical protein